MTPTDAPPTMAAFDHAIERDRTFRDAESLSHLRALFARAIERPAQPGAAILYNEHGPWVQISGKYISIDHGETPQVFRDATDAELRLMLHAPDLLAALRDLCDAIPEDAIEEDPPLGAWRDAARAAIAKVEAPWSAIERPACDGSCDIALARRQVGPDGIVSGNARECAELWEREASRLHVLLSAYRYKRANDGLNGRGWDAGKHLAADDRIKELERGGTP